MAPPGPGEPVATLLAKTHEETVRVDVSEKSAAPNSPEAPAKVSPSIVTEVTSLAAKTKSPPPSVTKTDEAEVPRMSTPVVSVAFSE